MGELCTISKGHGYSKADIRDDGTPLILYGRLYTQYESRIENVDTFAVEQEGSLLSKGNEVIVPASGETAEDIAVASSVRRSGIIFGGDLNVVTPASRLDPDYTALAITYSKAHDDLARRAQGKSVVHVHGNDIAEVEISYPSESEQKRISTTVLTLDNLITLHQRKRRKRLFTHLLVWEQRKFSAVAIERRETTEVEDEDVLLTCAIEGIFLNSDYFSHFRGQSNIGYLKVRKNMLILSAQNLHLGNANVNLKYDHGIISPAYKVYDLLNCSPLFMYSWVKRPNAIIFFDQATTAGASLCRKNIEWNYLNNLPLCLPASLKEQHQIGSFFARLDNLITLHQ